MQLKPQNTNSLDFELWAEISSYEKVDPTVDPYFVALAAYSLPNKFKDWIDIMIGIESNIAICEILEDKCYGCPIIF